jgi:hypothetical protein
MIHDARGALDDLVARMCRSISREVGSSSVRTAESVRARWLAALACDLPRSGCWVEAPVPHLGDRRLQRGNPEDWFGIANQDGSPKPSRHRFRAIGTGAAAQARTTICGPGRR